MPTEKKLKIAIVSRGIPTKEDPMLGIFEWDQANALKALGHEVTFFVLDYRSVRRKRSLGFFERTINGIRVLVDSFPVGAVPTGLFIRIGTRRLGKLYRKAFPGTEKPDILHAHFTEMGCIAAGLAKKHSLPLVITEHSSILAGDNPPEKLVHFATEGYTTAQAVIAVTDTFAKKIKDLTGVSCRVVPNVISEKPFAGHERREHTGFRFVTVANLIPRKRVGMLIDAFRLLGEAGKDASLLIIGDGEERKMLEEKTAGYGLEGKVSFTGRLTRDEIAEQFRDADCFVLASEKETFGVVYVEAMMAGLPVIASRCGGPEDFVTEETGLLDTFDDPEVLAGYMRRMLEEHDRYDPKVIREYAVLHFSPAVVAEELTKVYDMVLAE